MAKDNKVLGTFRLDGIPAAPRGVPRFAITFKIDANGILNVKAKDVGTGKEQQITITASTQLEAEEIEKLVKEAEANAEKDKKELDKLKTKNEADSLIFQAEKTLKDNAEKVDESSKKSVEEESQKLKDLLAKDDGANLDEIKKQTEALMSKLQEVGAKLYESAKPEDRKEETTQENGEKKDDNKDKPVEGEVVE